MSKYFEQHEIPPGNDTGPYAYTRCFYIYPKFGFSGGKAGLSLEIEPMTESKDEWGTPKAEKVWERLAEDLMKADPPERSSKVPMWFSRPRTPLNLAVSDQTRVVIRLLGKFWRFSNDLHGLTTKKNFNGKYYNLKRHKLDGNGALAEPTATETCRCISFFTGTPDDHSLGVRDGFSLNIELIEILSDGSINKDRTLPITIDPDVENKGGNPHPLSEEYEELEDDVERVEPVDD